MTQQPETPGNPATPEAPEPPEAPNTPEVPSIPSAPGFTGAQEILEPTWRPQFPDFPDNLEFLNDKIILDTNIFSNFTKAPHEVLSRVGGRPIHHTKEIYFELSMYYQDSRNPITNPVKLTNSVLEDFSSTLLPTTTEVETIAGIIRDHLLLAGLQSEQMEATKNDVQIVSCGIAHKADIISSDRLFYVIGKIFETRIRIILLTDSLSDPPEGWVTTMSNTLKNRGTSTPIDLPQIMRNQD